VGSEKEKGNYLACENGGMGKYYRKRGVGNESFLQTSKRDISQQKGRGKEPPTLPLRHKKRGDLNLVPGSGSRGVRTREILNGSGFN